MLKTSVLKILFVVASLTSTEVAHAQYFTGPMAAGTGGAGRAMVEGSESTFLNPATAAYIQRNYGAAYFTQSSHPESGDDQTYGVLLSDGTAERLFAGSLGYLRRRVDVGGANTGVEANEQFITGTLADRFAEKFAFGVTGHYRIYEQDNTPKHNQLNFDLGLIYSPLETLGIAFVAYNVISAPEKVPAAIRDVPALALGVNYIFNQAYRVSLDFVRPDKLNPGRRVDVKGGLESEFENGMAVRVGGNFQETVGQTWVTGGLGYRGPRLSFNYTFEQDVRVSGGNRHLVDLWLPF